ncbi:MAG: DUF5053 domain-containing protein [Bacteroidaceae bacterium]|jgi:hypothetical protein|nr:DUF5053 domain-containing protein [Bacteroidaceae bacterium]MBR6629810.1 DUF5053 domain-containing protein [Bacteroidaceae bacterium]
MKTLQEELKELGAIMNATTDENDTRYQEKFLYIKENYTTSEDAEAIADFMLSRFDSLNNKVEEFKKQLSIQEQFEQVKDIVSVSYIAKNYFGKSAAWLQQRIYGYKVRGKVYSLSNEDVNTFNHALQDISKRIGSLQISL